MANLTKKQEAHIQSLPPDQRRAERAIFNETILMDIRKDPPIPRYKPPKPKPKSKRKGGNVKGYLVGDLINPLGPTGGPPGTPQGAGVGKGVAPQKKQNPLAVKDTELKKIALKKKELDVAGAKPKAPAPKPGMAPPVMPQKPPRRKGGKIKMRGGGPIAKSYSNMCVSPAYNRKK